MSNRFVSNRNRTKNYMVSAGLVCFVGLMGSIPYFARANTANLMNKEQLTGSQRQRGMFTNLGSDAGPDPDWDPVERKWKGFERIRKQRDDERTAYLPGMKNGFILMKPKMQSKRSKASKRWFRLHRSSTITS